MLELPDKASLKVPQVQHSGNAASTYHLWLARKVWSLHRGRSRKAIVRVVPDADSPRYRIAWPDGLSPPANLTRCKDAARQWAERKVLTEDRKNTAGRRLKLLENFSWSASPIRFFERPVSDTPPAVKRTRELSGSNRSALTTPPKTPECNKASHPETAPADSHNMESAK